MTSPPSRHAAWKWWITGILLLATMINYMDRLTLNTASEEIKRELFAGENFAYGNLELGFGWAFAAGSLVFGFLADRMSVYLLYPIVLVGWSAMGICSGLSQGPMSLFVFRILLGFFEAGHWPCALKTTFALLEEKDRTMGNSILQSGASVGAVITPQLMKLFLNDEPGSWRAGFIVVGAIGAIWCVLWFLSLRPRDLECRHAGARPVADTGELLQILRGGRFWAVALLLVGPQIAWQINRVWLTSFLRDGRGYDKDSALNFVSTYFIATDVGCFLAGAISLWLVRRAGITPHRSRRLIYFGGCLLTSLCVLIPWLGRGPLLLCTLMLIGAGALAMFPCYYSFVQELSAKHVGRLTGLLSMWVWAVTSPLQSVFGYIADHANYDTGLVVAGLCPWLGVVSMRVLWRPDKSIPAAKHDLG
jgi:ACS family hexuronate transporter-like MFS transporter